MNLKIVLTSICEVRYACPMHEVMKMRLALFEKYLFS